MARSPITEVMFVVRVRVKQTKQAPKAGEVGIQLGNALNLVKREGTVDVEYAELKF